MKVYWTILEHRQKELKGYGEGELEYVEVLEPTDQYFLTEEAALDTVEVWLEKETEENRNRKQKGLRYEYSTYTIIKVYTNLELPL